MNSKSAIRPLQPELISDDPWLAGLKRCYRSLLPRGGAGLLLAVSGGTDSAALLWGTARIASQLQLRLEVASFDHGLRPESAEEVAGVAAWARDLGFRFHTRRLGLVEGAGVEARAREARYRTLRQLCLEQGLDWVATAHTASDQAETLLMRLARGIALRGARGIAVRQDRLIRPMLAMTRADAVAFLERVGCRPFEDPSNRDLRQLRSRFRHRLLPRFAEVAGLSPSALAERLAHFSQVASEDEALLQRWADRAYLSLARGGGRLDAVGVRALEAPLRRRVLIRLLEEAGLEIDGALIERVDAAVLQGRRTTLPARLWLEASSVAIRLGGKGDAGGSTGD